MEKSKGYSRGTTPPPREERGGRKNRYIFLIFYFCHINEDIPKILEIESRFGQGLYL